MICKNCKKQIPDDSIFCPSCGQRVDADPVAAPVPTFCPAGNLDGSDSKIGATAKEGAQVASKSDTDFIISSNFNRPDGHDDGPTAKGGTLVDPEIATIHVDPIRCLHCGCPLTLSAKFCSNCGKSLEETTFTVRKGPKLSKKGIIASSCAALLLVVILIVGFATNWFGATGPAVRITSAVGNTFSADSFTVDFEYTCNEDEYWDAEIQGTAYVAIDPDKRELTFYADLTVDGESGVIAIYDGYYIMSSYGECWGYDISEELDACFDLYEEGTAKDFSWEDFFDSIAYEGAYEEASEDIDFDKLNTCFAAYLKRLNSKKWLDENAGYSVEKDGGVTMHCFSPDIYTFLKASTAELEDAFIDEDVYDEINDDLSDLRSGSKETNTRIVFGIKGNKLVHFELEFSGSDDSLTAGADHHITASFYDIGKTKFDTDELEDMLAEVKRYDYWR